MAASSATSRCRTALEKKSSGWRPPQDHERLLLCVLGALPVPDGGRQAGGGGGASGPGLLPGGSASAAGLRGAPPVRSVSRSAAVSAPSGLHHRDPPQTIPSPLLDGLRRLGAEVHNANRGGLITFHGPGQLVCYPVLHLGSFKKSVRWYVSQLEQTVISACGRLGVAASSSPLTGVWVGDNKICAIGIHCGRYVTSHGLALNCNTDMSWFGHIVPCGIVGKGVTSLSAELRRDVGVEEAVPHLLEAFRDQFHCQLTDSRD